MQWGEEVRNPFNAMPASAGPADAGQSVFTRPVDPWNATAEVPTIASVDGRAVPLAISGQCVLDNRTRYEHCEIAMEAGFPILTGGNPRIIDNPTVIVGTGPSAIALLPEIRARYERGEEIIAIKGAHDWLIANGIIPRAAIAMDPQKARAKCFRKLQRKVLYLCASQMHPDTWEHMRGFQTLIWHTRIEADQERTRPEWSGRFIVPCCTTTGNNSLILLHRLGRRNFHLYGFDSSIPEPRTLVERMLAKVRGRLIKLDGFRARRDKRITTVVVDGRSYQTTAELVQQAQEIYPLLKFLRDASVSAYGDGSYQAVLRAGKAQGWPV
jgi:hypothetical protein